MKTKILLISLIFPILLTGCIHYGITDPPASGTTITITAGLPGESASSPGNGEDMPDTRVGLTQDGLNVKLTWEKGDKIYLVYRQGTENKGKETISLGEGNIINDGKKASFSIPVPVEITEETFDLYGVYGATGFNGATYDLNLPATPWSGTLTEVQNKDLILLSFAKTGLSSTNPSFSVSFAHVGSLFHIQLKNTSSSALNGITKAELVAGSAIQANQNSGSATYNPVTGAFSGTTATGTSLPFDLSASRDLAVGGTLDFWGWYPPVADQNWPALSLRVTATGGPYTSIDTKVARTSATAAGKAYHFYADYDGTKLYFTNSARTEGYFTDSRDDNVYKTITIDAQTWMAENLAYLTSVIYPGIASRTKAYSYVYGFEDTSVSAAKATSNYTTYGVLYNWTAAKTACPEGWHLPSDAEWTQLETFLANNGYNYDGSTGGSGEYGVRAKIGKSMATNSGWRDDSRTGSVGNTDYAAYRNKSGFSALPGGCCGSDGEFECVGSDGYWWSSSNYSDYDAKCRRLAYGLSLMILMNGDKMMGYSVRCVRN